VRAHRGPELRPPVGQCYNDYSSTWGRCYNDNLATSGQSYT
jgi:hypothetical protein